MDRLAFFFILGHTGLAALLLVSMEKVKSGPIVTEKLKTWPQLDSAWQKSNCIESRVEPTLVTAAILVLLLN